MLTLCRTANIAKLNPKLPELEKAIEMEDLALNPPVANELTPQVIALDEERDRAYQALMSRVRSYAYKSLLLPLNTQRHKQHEDFYA